jgi:hypothetical protein
MKQQEISSPVTDRIITVDKLLEMYNISLDHWDIEKQIINTWEIGAKTPDGSIATTPLFQVKVWLRSKIEIKELEEIRQEFIEDLKKVSPKIPKIVPPYKPGDECLLEINIFDLHLGKMAWNEETGDNYNSSIAVKLFEDSISDFINNTQHLNIKRIVFPIGNDFFNSDKSHPFNSTTKGTPQEEDTRWQKTFRTGRKLLVDQITRLSEIAPIDVIMIPGNHDYERNFYLGDSLEGWFYNNPNVTVDNGPSPRKYYLYNNTLIGYTHGNEEKISDLPLLMAQEAPTLWASSKYREFHLGHMHHKKEIKYKSTEEYQGVIIRFMSSLSGTDSWHHRKGYVGSKKAAEAYIWDKDKGLKMNIIYAP